MLHIFIVLLGSAVLVCIGSTAALGVLTPKPQHLHTDVYVMVLSSFICSFYEVEHACEATNS